MIERIRLPARGPGLHEFTPEVTRVVEQAGVSKGALQHHFPSKEDLMASTAAYLLARPVEYSDRQTSITVRERLRAFWERARPPGFWGPVAATPDGPRRLARGRPGKPPRPDDGARRAGRGGEDGREAAG